MRYIVIIYYVLIEGEQVFETLNVNKNIEANSPEEAIGIASVSYTHLTLPTILLV